MSKKPASSAPQGQESEDQVKLPHILGIRPGVYLTILYSLILLTILFFLLIYPGITNPGSVLVLKTNPDGAALRVDGTFMGTAKNRIFATKGRHTLEAVLPGFEPQSAVHEIPGRVFGSRFFPRKYPLEFSLKTNDPAGVFATSASEFAEWSFGGEPTTAWQIPLSLSEGAYRIGPQADHFTAEILPAASRFTTTRAALRDLVRAKMLLDARGNSPSPAGIAGSISNILVFLSENPGSAEWLAGLLPPESAALVKDSGWYKKETVIPQRAEHHVSQPGYLYRNNRFELAGLSFIELNGFMISETQVPRSLFETFLNENPSWREDDVYPDSIPVGTEITGVSWYAAEAFCQWLTKRLPSSMAGMETRLPMEIEWIIAVAEGIGNIGNKNNGWEWCYDPYAPLNFIKAEKTAERIVGSPERSLRSADLGARASLPPELASPVVSFRVVIAEKENP